MNLPSQTQINAAVRYSTAIVSSIIGTVAVVLHLQNQGIYLEGAKTIIDGMGAVAIAVVQIATVVTAIVAAVKGIMAANPTQQAKSLESQGNIIIASPEMAAATPDNPNIVSRDEVKVVPK